MMETQFAERETKQKLRGDSVDPAAPRGRSPLTGAPVPLGRQKGKPNRLTRTIKEAVEMAARDCHPQGLAGWLVERANGSLGDRQIFAAMVAKALPLQVNANVSGGITISMPWLGQRGVAGTTVAQLDTQRAQVIDSTDVSFIEHRINDASDQAGAGSGGAEVLTPHPPASRGRGGAEAGAPPTTSSISNSDPSR